MTIHTTKKGQKVLVLTKKVIVLAEYLDFANVFLEKLTNILLKQTGLNEHIIELEQANSHYMSLSIV